MNTKLKKTLITITTTLFAVLIVTTATYAIGTLTPSGTPGDDTQYSLNDIYSKLTDFGDTPTATSSPFTVPGSVSASFRTLTEIYGLLEAEEDDLVPGNIADNVTIFGVEGTMEAGISYPTQWSTEDPTGYVTWQAAMDYCDYLETDGSTVNVAVQNIWRLPSYIELVNAYLTGVSSFQSDFYWSSTEIPYSTGNAYFVIMYYGSASYNDKTFPSYLARCTR